MIISDLIDLYKIYSKKLFILNNTEHLIDH